MPFGASPQPVTVRSPDVSQIGVDEPHEQSKRRSGMDREGKDESLMEATGLGLLPGLAGAMVFVVLVMALLLTGSMWAVFGVLAVVGLTAAAIVFVVVALTTEGERGRLLRAWIPGLDEPSVTQRGREC
jgi:hypothetical protein